SIARSENAIFCPRFDHLTVSTAPHRILKAVGGYSKSSKTGKREFVFLSFTYVVEHDFSRPL
ncbi:hypothetical protein RJ639_024806, partial [Escallonia herrerae]